ncbi:hypothetical protein [Kerstersia gyiorum]|uniref:Uncharacterized protein n=1 Tax=Kerstersia gyiorum TaxID=206506 RepID=A0A171KSF5_9BURK|nr:hypothetical protein [Kerstersia gyiorum]KKO71822.1 hypothetical protein AAV32_09605 [Kerstersia gyiorum]
MTDNSATFARIVGNLEAQTILSAAVAAALKDSDLFTQAIRAAYDAKMRNLQLEGRPDAVQQQLQAALKEILQPHQVPFESER